MIFGGKKLWSIANAASEVILKGLGGKRAFKNKQNNIIQNH